MTRIPILTGLLAALLGAVSGHAQTASLVADLMTSEGAAVGSFPEELTPVRGGRIVFEATESSSGSELWASDGTAQGTVLLADILPGTGDYFPGLLVHETLDGVAIFSGFGWMWRSDGTREGTFPLRDPGEGGATLTRFGYDTEVFGGFVYFEGCGSVRSCGLWRTDGTPAGTRLVASFDRLGGEGLRFAVAGRFLFFALYRPDFTSALLWRTDGTAAGTVRLATFRDLQRPLPESLTPVGDKLFFAGPGSDGEELWVSDGTRAGTRPLTNFRPSLPFGGGYSHEAGEPLLFADEGRIDFAAFDGKHGWQVWQSDGTPEGTRLLTDFAFWYPFVDKAPVPLAKVGGRLLVPVQSGYRWGLWSTNGRTMVRLHACLGGCRNQGDEPPRLMVYGDQVLFTAGAGSGQELWSTDGTGPGTRKLFSACTDACHRVIGLTTTTLGGLAVFRISEHGKDQLWVTDGTAAGTRPLFHLPPGTSTGALPVAAGAKIFFSAAHEDGMELWVSEGGAERQVVNLASEADSSSPSSPVALGSHLVFQAGPLGEFPSDFRKGSLWQSEGTAATTSRLLDPFRLPPDCDFYYCVKHMADADRWLALVNTPRDEVSELWRTDGTAEGTFRLFTVEAPGRLPRLAAFQDTVVFFVEFPHHLEIWRSDGTPAGTYRIAHQAGRLRVFNAGGTGTEVHFQIWGARTLDLWRSDGTSEGTVQVAALPPGPGLDWIPPEMPPIRVGDRVCFASYEGRASSEQIWCTDGTQEGTVKLLDVDLFGNRDWRVLDGKLYLMAYVEPSHGLWSTDGTAAGTVRLRGFLAMPTSLTVFNGRLFFATDESLEQELWTSDGTRDGTRLFVDINPDGPADPTNFAVFRDRLYFSAYDPEHGYELWQTDGTAGGTRLAQDIAPGSLSSAPEQLKVVGDRLYFTAYDHATGRELWSLQGEP